MYVEICNAEPGSHRHQLAEQCDRLTAEGKASEAQKLWRDSGFEALLAKDESEAGTE